MPDRMSLDWRLLRLMQGVLKLPRANGSAQRLPRLTRHQTDPINRILAEHVEQTLAGACGCRDTFCPFSGTQGWASLTCPATF